MTNPLRNRLVPDWRECWRWFSTWLVSGFGLAVSYVATNPSDMFQALAYVPDELRPLIGLVLVAAYLACRLWKQRPKEPK